MATSNPWKFYRWTHDAWDGMLAAITEARSFIDFEQYYFVDLTEGKIGHRFVEALRKKVREGVKVRLLLDATGSWEFYRSRLVAELKSEGVEIRFHETISKKDAGYFFQSFLRDHRRLLIVDGKVGFVGGIAIKDAAEMWRDTHAELHGPVVDHLQKSFDTLWESVITTNRYRITKPESSPDKFTVLPNGIRFKQRFIYRFLLEAIRDAKKSIYITSPYFSPDRALFRALRLAAKRGVDVRFLFPHTADFKFAKLVCESFYDGALDAGIQIYEYTPSFIHAKTIIIDDDWGSVGSMNFDQLSFFFNYELNVVSYDHKFVLELKNHFFDDLQSSMKIVKEEWRKRSIFRKILQGFSFVFRPLV